MDFSKYIEQQKLTDTINPITRKFENILKELESIRRDMNEIEVTNKDYNKNAINKFEEESTNKMNEFRAYIQKNI